MNEKRAIFGISLLKNIIDVYFDTFFVFYFFRIANYEVIPLVKYYFILYLFISVGFFIIRNFMKQNIKVPYLRIGISLQAIFITLIMILKENIINYIIPVAIIRGIADGFYHFPKNMLDAEKIVNKERQQFDGVLVTIKKIISIIIPLLLGILLTYFSYTDLAKIFFILFVIMFMLTFYLKDKGGYNKKFDFKSFMKLLKKNKNVNNGLLLPFLAGFSHSGGVMGLVITLANIHAFKTNLNLGIVDSICAVVALLTCFIYTVIKKEHLKKLTLFSGIISFTILMLFSFKQTVALLICYLIVRNSCITFISMNAATKSMNVCNDKSLNEQYKSEYIFTRDLMYALSRCSGYLILLIICFLFGINSIYYILIISGIALLLESLITNKI